MQSDPRILGNADVFENYKYADSGGLNFYERYVQFYTTLAWGWVNDSDFQNLSKVKRVQDSLKIRRVLKE
ncbi:hypothetical protein GH721_08660 [Kriegella sp. EG-1]|nr:hypothetical protein [Flavobacteriaceae bacterium EG-1]